VINPSNAGKTAFYAHRALITREDDPPEPAWDAISFEERARWIGVAMAVIGYLEAAGILDAERLGPPA